MKKIRFFVLLITSCATVLMACNTATPENYFDRAVLNCNMMTGFGDKGLQRQLEQPSVKLVEGTKDQSVPMKRKEVIDNLVQYLDESFAKIKALKETNDSRDMLQASTALYAYTLPVYKNEYTQLAKLYDDGAPAATIAALAASIQEKYAVGFADRYNKVIEAGKPFALRHNINVKWDIHSSPENH
ncbi:MAG: hypothetical protein ABIU63_15875 [Chitinophagaceae bacterium]